MSHPVAISPGALIAIASVLAFTFGPASDVATRAWRNHAWPETSGIYRETVVLCRPHIWRGGRFGGDRHFGLMDCADARKLTADAPNRRWRNDAVAMAVVETRGPGGSVPHRFEKRALDQSLVPGGRLSLFVDPADPTHVERPLAASDMTDPRIGAGVALAFFAFGMGWIAWSLRSRILA